MSVEIPVDMGSFVDVFMDAIFGDEPTVVLHEGSPVAVVVPVDIYKRLTSENGRNDDG